MRDVVSDGAAADRSPDRRPRDFYITFALAAAAALLHTCALFELAARGGGRRTLASPAVPLIFLLIEAGLLANVLGAWVRRASGVFVSLAGLTLAGAGYVLWYAYSKPVLELLLSKPFYRTNPDAVPAHPFGLLGATWVEQVVLLVSCVLFVRLLPAVWGVSRRGRAGTRP